MMPEVVSKGSSNHLKLEHIIKHNSVVQYLYRVGMSTVFKVLGKLIKTDDTTVLFNGHGYKYNDSPKVIFEKMRELGMLDQYHAIWALNNPDSVDIPECKKVKMDTLEYFVCVLRAKYWISCVNIERALKFKKPDQVYLNTWHGAAINVCGNGVPGRNDFHWDHIDYFCSCSKYDEIFFGRDLEVRPNSFIKTGYPRNDELYHITEEKKKSIKDKLSLPKDKKIILYAPTWRESEDKGASFQLAPPINWNKWKRILGDEYVVLLRTHPYTTELMDVMFNDFVMNYSEYPEINDLLIASDILISDYSSIILDYCILGRPIICFGYDYDEYKKTRGFYYDLETELPNGVMRDEDEIIRYLKKLDYSNECYKTEEFRKRHMQYGGDATNACIQVLFDK